MNANIIKLQIKNEISKTNEPSIIKIDEKIECQTNKIIYNSNPNCIFDFHDLSHRIDIIGYNQSTMLQWVDENNGILKIGIGSTLQSIEKDLNESVLISKALNELESNIKKRKKRVLIISVKKFCFFFLLMPQVPPISNDILFLKLIVFETDCF
eukprot:63629_1